MSAYLLKVTLRGTPQLIWRRFVVPSFTSLNRLHGILQDVMGWENRHPHAFRFRKQCYVPGTNGGKNAAENRKRKDISGDSQAETLPDEMFSLDDIIFQAGPKLLYIYDPDGADWQHDICVESIRYINPDWPFPIYCLEGVRACPPESCGGVGGFCELLRSLKSETNDGRRFEPDCFSLEAVNRRFKVAGPVPVIAVSACRLPDQKAAKSATPSEKTDPLLRLGRTLKNQPLKKKAAS